MSAIAIIPARGGSKRIPRKNIREFCGKPIIGHSIEAARESGLFERVVVSTDDPQIAEVARDFGAETPFLRDATLAGDRTPTVPVVGDAVRRLEEAGFPRPDAVCCLMATSPLLSAEILRAAHDELMAGDHAYVFSVAKIEAPIFRAFELDAKQRPKMFWPENRIKASSDFPDAYHDAGKFYWGRPDPFLEEKAVMLHPKSKGFVIPWWMAIDIDDEDDWQRAEFLASSFDWKSEPPSA